MYICYMHIIYIYIYIIYIYIYPYITILRLGMREVNLLKFVQCLENIRQEKWRIFVMFDWMFMVVKERYLNIICDNVESFWLTSLSSVFPSAEINWYGEKVCHLWHVQLHYVYVYCPQTQVFSLLVWALLVSISYYIVYCSFYSFLFV